MTDLVIILDSQTKNAVASESPENMPLHTRQVGENYYVSANEIISLLTVHNFTQETMALLDLAIIKEDLQADYTDNVFTINSNNLIEFVGTGIDLEQLPPDRYFILHGEIVDTANTYSATVQSVRNTDLTAVPGIDDALQSILRSRNIFSYAQLANLPQYVWVALGGDPVLYADMYTTAQQLHDSTVHI